MKNHIVQRLLMLIMYMAPTFKVCNSANILIIGSIMRGRGHTSLPCAVSAELTSRGHHVTILVPSDNHLKVGEKFASSNATEILKYETIPTEESDDLKLFRAGNRSNLGLFSSLKVFSEVQNEQVNYCRQLLKNNLVMTKLKKAMFDLMIADMGNGCDALLPEILQLPFVALTSNTEFPLMNYLNYGFPLELSYVISPYMIQSRDGYIKSIKNILLRHTVPTILRLFAIHSFTSLKDELNILPGEDIYTLAGKAQFWLSQSNLLWEPPHPTMPNWSPIGGMAAARPGILPLDFAEFTNGCGEAGLIVFSTGSIVRGIDANFSESLASIFSSIPQRVVWKHGGPTPKNLGSNTRVYPWLPQLALLAHPKTRLFIGHGGLNGIFEALYHGVPMILIPQMMYDQTCNALRVEELGCGLLLDKKQYSADLLKNKIDQVLNNSSFADNVRRVSAVLQDDDPMDRAVFWIEHIIKYGGKHLRAEVFNLNFVQYYMLDVFVFFLLNIILLVFALYFTFTRCYSLCKRYAMPQKFDKLD